MSIPPDAQVMDRMGEMIERGASDSGREFDRDDYLTCSLTTIVVLDEGETIDSHRVKAEAGAMAMASIHYSYDQYRQYGRPPGSRLTEIWDDYTSMLSDSDAERIHHRIHAGHHCWVIPEEERFVTSKLIDATCIVGTASEVIERLQQLEARGLDQLMILPNFDPRYQVLERVGKDIIPHL